MMPGCSTRVVPTDRLDAHLVIRLPALHQVILRQRDECSPVLELLTLVTHYAVDRHAHLLLMSDELPRLLMLVAHHAAPSLLLFYLSQIHSPAALFQEIIILCCALGHTLRIARGMLEVLGIRGLLSSPLRLEILWNTIVIGVI